MGLIFSVESMESVRVGDHVRVRWSPKEEIMNEMDMQMERVYQHKGKWRDYLTNSDQDFFVVRNTASHLYMTHGSMSDTHPFCSHVQRMEQTPMK